MPKSLYKEAEAKIFKLKGKTLTIIDWANIYGWLERLKWEIKLKKLYDYLRSYPEIGDLRFYFGIEKGNKKSEEFHQEIKKIGYNVISKELKWVPVYLEISLQRKNKRITQEFIKNNYRQSKVFS